MAWTRGRPGDAWTANCLRFTRDAAWETETARVNRLTALAVVWLSWPCLAQPTDFVRATIDRNDLGSTRFSYRPTGGGGYLECPAEAEVGGTYRLPLPHNEEVVVRAEAPGSWFHGWRDERLFHPSATGQPNMSFSLQFQPHWDHIGLASLLLVGSIGFGWKRYRDPRL